jgi:hypothetical protein
MATVPARGWIASARVSRHVHSSTMLDLKLKTAADNARVAGPRCQQLRADARLLPGDNLSQEPMEQAGTIVVTSANEPVVVDSVEGSEDRARIIED